MDKDKTIPTLSKTAVSSSTLIEIVKSKLPYGKTFAVYNKCGLVGIYTSNNDFVLINNGTSVIMDTTKVFDEWSSAVTVYENGNFVKGID